MLAISKFVNFRKGFRLVVPVSTNPIPGMFFEELETEMDPHPVPERLEELLGPPDPICLDDIFGDLIAEQRSFSLHAE